MEQMPAYVSILLSQARARTKTPRSADFTTVQCHLVTVSNRKVRLHPALPGARPNQNASFR